MSIIGNVNEFAIEWKLETKEGDYWYGYLCFWIGGYRIGNFSEISTITISISYLKTFMQNKPYRQWHNSAFLSNQELFYQLYKKFFLSGSITDESYLKMGELSDIFWLDEVGEYSFRDKLGIIMLDEPKQTRQRFIWQFFDNEEIIHEYFIPFNHFEPIANEYIKMVEIISSRMEP